jgi:hypothetical protein
MRVHLDVMNFREALTKLAAAQDSQGFAAEAASQRDNFVQDVARAEETLNSSRHLEQDVPIMLEAVRTSLPSQTDTLVALAKTADWEAVSLRLASQVRAMVGLTSLLVFNVDQEVAYDRAQALESTQHARRQLLLVLSVGKFVM